MNKPPLRPDSPGSDIAPPRPASTQQLVAHAMVVLLAFVALALLLVGASELLAAFFVLP